MREGVGPGPQQIGLVLVLVLGVLVLELLILEVLNIPKFDKMSPKSISNVNIVKRVSFSNLYFPRRVPAAEHKSWVTLNRVQLA